MKTHMTMDEKRTIIEWFNSNPMIKDNARLEDEDMMKITDKLAVGLETVQRRLFKAIVGGDTFSMNMNSTVSW
eukprot:12954031-Heterocapsa_arctica.AAC.1